MSIRVVSAIKHENQSSGSTCERDEEKKKKIN